MFIPLNPDRAVGELLERAETSSAVSLTPITQALGGSYSLLFRRDTSGNVTEASCHGVDLGYLDRLRDAARLRLLPAWLAELPVGSVVDRASFGSDRQFGRTDFCNHVVRPEGDFHCMIATPFACGADRFHLVVGRPRIKREFDADSRRLLSWMLPQIAEILQLRADLALTRRDLGFATRALNGLQEPVFVVAQDGTVTSLNHAGQNLIAARDGIRLCVRARLSGGTLSETVKLRSAIQATAAGGGKAFVTLERRPGQDPLHLTLSPLGNPESAVSGVTDVLIVIEAANRTDDGQRVASVARTYGLTRREIDLVTLLTKGATLKDAARTLGLSYNTARGYVRQVFGKTALHRQTDLLRLFATGHRPSARPS
jgi:DNA-binding CsgD family transcriptional regulator